MQPRRLATNLVRRLMEHAMPKYRFHFVPQDGKGDVYLTYAGDDEALSEARHALRHIGWFDDAPKQGTPKTVEIIREDMIVVGIVTAENS
jgi:hypothetical protein